MSKGIKCLGRINCIIVALLLLFKSNITVYAVEEYAYSIGTDYGLLDTLDTSTDAETASTSFALAGYRSYYNTAPNVDYMKGNNPAGIRRIGSAVVFYSGHGSYNCMAFNYEGRNGVYKTGVYYAGDYLSPDTGYNYVGIQDTNTNMQNNKLSVFGGCNTASGTDNITKRAYSSGSDAAIGWTQSVGASSHSQWLSRFTNELANGKSVSEAAQYANGFTYSDTNVKAYKIYGDTTLVIKRNVQRNELTERHVNLTERINVDISQGQITHLTDYMEKHLGIDIENVRIEITDLLDGNGVVDYKLLIGDCETTSGYVAIINNNNVKEIYKNNVDFVMPRSITHNEINLDKALQEAINNIKVYDKIVNQEVKKMYDVLTDERYYLISTTYLVADNCMSVDSYKYYGE